MTVTEVAPRQNQILEAKIDLLTEQVALLTADAELRSRQRQIFDGLTADLSRVSEGAVEMATDRLAEAEDRGYFAFARAGAGVVDRVVTGFDEEDLTRLGENVVTILEAIKQITQPEMLAFLGHMVDAVKLQQERVESEPQTAPNLRSLIKTVRDPDVRRGMARALETLRVVSVETGPDAEDIPTDSTPRGEQ